MPRRHRDEQRVVVHFHATRLSPTLHQHPALGTERLRFVFVRVGAARLLAGAGAEVGDGDGGHPIAGCVDESSPRLRLSGDADGANDVGVDARLDHGGPLSGGVPSVLRPRTLHNVGGQNYRLNFFRNEELLGQKVLE